MNRKGRGTIKLSKRLETVASFVEKGSRIADVGTDHGYIPIVLMERGQASGAIAMDVGAGPLERAREHIRERQLESTIETRLCDGVRCLAPGEADTVIIAGMGGELVIHIMGEGSHLWDSVKHWILSPQSELDKVRRFLDDHGFAIAKEDMVEEDGKYYTVMDIERETGEGSEGQEGRRSETGGVWDSPAEEGDGKREEELREAKYLFGPRLIEEKHPVLMEFLKKEERVLENIIEGLKEQESLRAFDRKKELEQRLSWVRRAME